MGHLVAALVAAAAAVAAQPASEGAGLPPTVVVRETRYYGTITIDHAAHLARKAHCRDCHGPGPIGKLVFTPKIAHDRCIGCHREVAKGPEKCQGCHVKPPTPPPQLTAAAAAAAGGEAAPPPLAPEPDPANVASALAALDRPPDWVRTEPFQRHVELGLSIGSGTGLSVRYGAHQDYWVITESVETLRTDTESRTLVLAGAGICNPGSPRRVLELSAVGGADVVVGAVVAMLPSIGLRGGVEWRQPTPFLQSIHASLTCVWDLQRSSLGREVGGTSIYLTIATGFRIR